MAAVVGLRQPAMKQQTPDSSYLGLSSSGLGWNGFSVLEYFGARGEFAEQPQERHIIGLWRGTVVRGERPNGRGGYIPYTRYPERITLVPPSLIPRHQSHNPYQVVLCLLEPAFLTQVGEEFDHRPTLKLRQQENIDDAPMRQLITLLASEAEQGGPLGRLYADHLAHSLAIRLLSLGGALVAKSYARASAMPRRLLNRVIERMHDFNDNLDLPTLAAETGYSRTHFLRMFRAATGQTPHHYLVRLRLKRAQELLRLGSMSLIDIAAMCGFSSHAHMSRIFRQLLGVTPSQYRRNS